MIASGRLKVAAAQPFPGTRPLFAVRRVSHAALPVASGVYRSPERWTRLVSPPYPVKNRTARRRLSCIRGGGISAARRASSSRGSSTHALQTRTSNAPQVPASAPACASAATAAQAPQTSTSRDRSTRRRRIGGCATSPPADVEREYLDAQTAAVTVGTPVIVFAREPQAAAVRRRCGRPACRADTRPRERARRVLEPLPVGCAGHDVRHRGWADPETAA